MRKERIKKDLPVLHLQTKASHLCYLQRPVIGFQQHYSDKKDTPGERAKRLRDRAK